MEKINNGFQYLLNLRILCNVGKVGPEEFKVITLNKTREFVKLWSQKSGKVFWKKASDITIIESLGE